jgi:excisionase family DNA binding protein
MRYDASHTDVITVEQAAEVLGIARGSAYQAVRSGEIPSLRIGRRILVPRVQLERLLDGETPDSPPGLRNTQVARAMANTSPSVRRNETAAEAKRGAAPERDRDYQRRRRAAGLAWDQQPQNLERVSSASSATGTSPTEVGGSARKRELAA